MTLNERIASLQTTAANLDRMARSGDYAGVLSQAGFAKRTCQAIIAAARVRHRGACDHEMDRGHRIWRKEAPDGHFVIGVRFDCRNCGKRAIACEERHEPAGVIR